MKNKKSFIAILDGESCLSKKRAISEIAICLKFPDEFGENLDALEDYLNDLSWIESEIVVLVIKNISQFLSDEENTLKGTFFSIFNDAKSEEYEGESELEKKEFYIFYSDSLYEAS